MTRRVIAAVLAIILAAIGIFLVYRYAQDADERAMEGMETQEVYVAVEPIGTGTPASDLESRVELRPVPEQFVIPGAVTDLADLDGELALTDVAEGEQLASSRWATADELRARDEFEVPKEAQDLHQVTVPLNTARALGGNIAAGDTVGVVMSFSATFQQGLYVDSDGRVRWQEDLPDPALQDGSTEESNGAAQELTIDLTQLALEKVLVLRVQGGYVPAPEPVATAEGEDGATEEEDAGPEDEILVTLAVSGSDAERLVYAMEFGTVWLSYQPESSEEDDDDVKVIQLPDNVSDVLQ